MEIGKYYDFLVVDPNGVEHQLHKIVLACHSEFFQAAFDSSFLETKTHKIELEYPDPRGVLGIIFKYFYTNEMEIHPETVVPLLNQSMFYQVSELCDLLCLEIKEMLPSHAITVLKDAVEFNMYDIISLASNSISENFNYFDWYNSDFNLNFLNSDTFLDILSNRVRSLETEFGVFQLISKYVNEKDSPKEVCDLLFSQVSFQYLLIEQLEKVVEDSKVCKYMFCKSLLEALKMALGKQSSVDSEKFLSSYTKEDRGRNFEYQSDFDKNGLIYWIGTLQNFNFVNPHDSGKVFCIMSSVLTGKPSNVVSRANVPTCTSSENESFIGIDLSPSFFVFKPNKYTLRHGMFKDNLNLKK